MTKILVVCKTRMKGALCVGALVAGSYERIRLLTPDGYQQPEDTQFNVGEIWECHLVHRPPLRKPHTEDMLVLRQDFVQRVSNMREFLMPRVKPAPAHQSTLFGGLLQTTDTGSAYIDERAGVPDHAHEFWQPLHELRLKIEQETRYYYILQDPGSATKMRLRYVGLEEAPARLPPGCLLHLSLARWWQPRGIMEERCYLQLSGVFM